MANTPNVDDLMAQYGYNNVGPAQFNPAASVQAQSGAAPKKSGFSFGNLIHSVGSLAGQAGGFVAHQIVDPVYHAGKAVAEGMPGVGTISQHYKAQAQIQKQVDHAIKDASARYRSKDPKVKISKQEYLKRLNDAQKLSQQSNQDTQDFTSHLESTHSALAGLGESALLLTGLGELKAAATAGKGITKATAKILPEWQAKAEAGAVKATGKIAPKTAAKLTSSEAAPAVTLRGIPKDVAKYALATKPGADAAIATPGDLRDHNYGNLAINAGAFVGAPLAVKGLQKAAPGIKSVASNLIFNKAGSEINKLKFAGGETVHKFLKGLEKSNPKLYQKYNDIAKVAEQHYKDEGTKAYDLTAYHAKHSMPVGEMSAQEFLDMQHGLAHSTKMTQALNEKGRLNFTPAELEKSGRLSKEEARAFRATYGVPETYADRLGVGRWQGTSKAAFTKRFLEADGPDARAALLKDAADRGEDFMKNPLIQHNLQKLAFETDPAVIKAELKSITGTRKIGIVGSGRTGLTNGYFPIIKPKGSAGFMAASDAAELGKPNHAAFAKVGNALRRAGISPEGTDPREFGRLMSTNFEAGLVGTQFEGQGGQVLSKMFELMDQTIGVFDPRLLKLSAIERGLDIGYGEAKMLRSALDAAYLKAPLGTRSLGEKLTDFLISKFPGQRQYLKAESYGRFAGNPIFWVKRNVKTELVAGAEVGGKTPNLGAALNHLIGTAPSDETMHLLKERGFFSKGMSQVGDANDFLGDFAATFGEGGERNAAAGVKTLSTNSVKSNLTKTALARYQQQSLGQMAEKFAKLHGTSVKDLMADNGELGEQFDHLMRLTIGYGQKAGKQGGYLTSNFAKTLNVLVFPSRFDTKVGMAFAKFYTQQPPIVQGAIALGAIRATEFLHSPEGQQWQRDNSEILSLLKYFTPIQTVGELMHALAAPGQVKLPDFGSVGGLPVGVLTTIAQHQGVAPDWLKQSPYHDPKTGELVPETLPLTDKARLQTAVADMISFMVSYPGKTLGLPTSKTQIIQGVVPGLKPTTGETEQINPETGEKWSNTDKGGWTPLAVPSELTSFKGSGLKKFNTDVIDHSKYAKPKKAKKPPAYVNGFKTTTARPLQ